MELDPEALSQAVQCSSLTTATTSSASGTTSPRLGRMRRGTRRPWAASTLLLVSEYEYLFAFPNDSSSALPCSNDSGELGFVRVARCLKLKVAMRQFAT